MLAALRRSVDFIAWANFVDPRVYALWLVGLAGVALVAYVAWHAGSLVYGRRRFDSATEQFAAGVVVGLAVTIPPLFALGMIGLYRPVPVALLAAILVVGGALRRGGELPKALLEPVTEWAAAVREHPLLWALFLICSLPALLPPYRIDETGYHLAQAQQWVNAGRLTVDPFMIYPLYANNWHLLQGIGLMLGGERLCHLETWMAGVLAALLVQTMLARLGVPHALRSVATVALFISPLFQRYLTVGLIDVPLMLFLTASAYAIWEIEGRAQPVDWRSVAAAAACAGMFVGMKSVNLLYIPLFAGLLIAFTRPWRAYRNVAVALAVFAVVGAPWYVRNLLLAGDPAPPLVHHALGLPDPAWSESDIRGISADLNNGLSRQPLALLALPVRVLVATEPGPLRDWPVLGYALLLPASLLLVRRLREQRSLTLLAVTWYSIAVWIGTSYLIRYAHFLPLAVVLGTLVLHAALERLGLSNRTRIAVLAGLLLLIGPTAAAFRYLKTPFANRIPVTAADAWTFELRWAPEAELLDKVALVTPPPDTIYSIGLYPFKYYFEKRGYYLIGHGFHRGRHADLASALRQGRGDEFFAGLPANSVVLYKRSAPLAFQMSGDSAVQALMGTSALHKVSEDSLGVVFRVDRRSLAERR